MSKDYCEVVCVLDKSTSMGNMREEAIEGYNAFLKDQQKIEGDAKLTLVLFDTVYKIVENGVDIQNAEPLTEKTYAPSGMTAMYDAIGKAIDTVGERLDNLPDSEKPRKVIVAILTDGQENSSREYKLKDVSTRIKHQEDKYNWEFFFLAANIDAFSTAGSFNIRAANTTSYDGTKDGTRNAYATLNSVVGSCRVK